MTKPSELLNNVEWLRHTAENATVSGNHLNLEIRRLTARLNNARKLEADCLNRIRQLDPPRRV